MSQRRLLQVSSGHVYVWTETLSNKKDMVEISFQQANAILSEQKQSGGRSAKIVAASQPSDIVKDAEPLITTGAPAKTDAGIAASIMQDPARAQEIVSAIIEAIKSGKDIPGIDKDMVNKMIAQQAIAPLFVHMPEGAQPVIDEITVSVDGTNQEQGIIADDANDDMMPANPVTTTIDEASAAISDDIDALMNARTKNQLEGIMIKYNAKVDHNKTLSDLKKDCLKIVRESATKLREAEIEAEA